MTGPKGGMSQHVVRGFYGATFRARFAAVIAFRDVSKRYGRHVALSSLSFEVGQRELVGFVGPNGAGKTTALRIMAGYLRPDSGSVSLAGCDVLSERHRACAHLGYVPEGAPMHDEMRVREYLEYRARLKGCNAVGERVDAVVEELELAEVERRLIGRLSRGFRQRVALADALVADPEVVLLDEPMTGLDPLQRRKFRELLKHLSGTRAVLISTHVLAEVDSIVDRFLVLHKGALIADGDATSLRERAKAPPESSLEEVFAALVEAGE
jgi:ABC-2 type transport system ATP-binding protein